MRVDLVMRDNFGVEKPQIYVLYLKKNLQETHKNTVQVQLIPHSTQILLMQSKKNQFPSEIRSLRKCQKYQFDLYINFYKKKSSRKVRMSKELRDWTPQEIKLLKELKNGRKQRKWKCISQIFAEKGWERSLEECRSQWISCLSSGINNLTWTDDELRLLYTLYNKYNSRWFLIQKHMPNRTQSKIKNHFYSVLRGITRHTLKYFKEAIRNETKITNKISPSELQLMYKGSEYFSFLEDLIPKCIESMNFRFKKHNFKKYVSKNLTKFQKLCKEIINLTNESLYPQDQESLDLNQDMISSDKNQKSKELEKLAIEQTIPKRSSTQDTVPQNYLFTSYNYQDNSWMYPQVCQIAIVPMHEFPQFSQCPINPDYCLFSCFT